MHSTRSSLAAVVAAVVVLASGHGAHAANPPITRSNYALDIYQGPVLAPVRVTGLAGAYAAIAEGVEGMGVNTAAPAARSLYSTKAIDYDLSLGATFPSSLKNTDFDNNGSVGFRYQDFVFVQVGGLIQSNSWGAGLLASIQTYKLGQDSSGRTLQLTTGRVQIQLARAFLDHQLLFGVGLRVATLGVDAGDSTKSELASMAGVNVEGGALWTPLDLPLRAALSLRAPVRGTLDPDSPTSPDAQGNVQVAGLYLPSSIVLPWEIEAGFAYQLGPRPLQIAWGPDRKERYKALPRQKILLTGSVLVSGAVRNAVGFESFLSQQVERSGRRVSISPRIGAEIEPLENRLQVRAGSYLEPSRFDRTHARLHGTAGLELRLFQWSVFGLFSPDTSWRINGVVDVAHLYFGWGVGVGLWH